MKIEKVKIQKNGYFVNGSSFVPNNPENRHFQLIQEYIKNGGVVEPEFSIEEKILDLKEKIRAEAARRILTPYPEYKQRNFLAKVALIHNQEVKGLKDGMNYQLNLDEEKTIADAIKCEEFIFGIRTKSNELEQRISTMSAEEREIFNPSDDSNWS